MKSIISKFQIGKQGLTTGVIESLKNDLKSHKQVRVSILKSAEKERTDVNAVAKEIDDSLTPFYKLAIRKIGYTIIITKLKDKKP